MANKYHYAIGRRKTAVASVRLFTAKGVSTINGKPMGEVYTGKFEQSALLRPYDVAGLKAEEHYFTAQVKGSGSSAQLQAITVALSKALVDFNPELRKSLKQQKLLTRDPRMVERKKPGLRKARKAEQYSKR